MIFHIGKPRSDALARHQWSVRIGADAKAARDNLWFVDSNAKGATFLGTCLPPRQGGPNTPWVLARPCQGSLPDWLISVLPSNFENRNFAHSGYVGGAPSSRQPGFWPARRNRQPTGSQVSPAQLREQWLNLKRMARSANAVQPINTLTIPPIGI